MSSNERRHTVHTGPLAGLRDAFARLNRGQRGETSGKVTDSKTSSKRNASDKADTGRTSREDLGRATWTFLHTLAAQFPEEPTRRQERDARELIGIMTRLYPCGECARHFEEIVRKNPPDCTSGLKLQRWMCEVHNEVNTSLGKPMFDCAKTSQRWSRLDCDGDGELTGCSLEDRRRRLTR